MKADKDGAAMSTKNVTDKAIIKTIQLGVNSNQARTGHKFQRIFYWIE